MNFADITAENSFWKMFKLAHKIKTPKDTFVAFFTALAILSIFYGLSFEQVNGDDIDKALLSISSTALTTSLSLLGFIFAAYLVFATMTDKVLMVHMASIKNPLYGMSYLKYGHCCFVKIMIDLLFVALISLVSNIYFSVATDYKSLTEDWQKYLYITLLAAHQSSFILILMLCKSAIYNVYHIIMVGVRWHAQAKEKDKDKPSPLCIRELLHQRSQQFRSTKKYKAKKPK